jgi:hypothetical protein
MVHPHHLEKPATECCGVAYQIKNCNEKAEEPTNTKATKCYPSTGTHPTAERRQVL